jgi:hypothetical protein
VSRVDVDRLLIRKQVAQREQVQAPGEKAPSGPRTVWEGCGMTTDLVGGSISWRVASGSLVGSRRAALLGRVRVRVTTPSLDGSNAAALELHHIRGFGVGGDARVGRRNTALHGCSVDGLVVMMPSRSNLRVDGPTSNSKLISYVGVLGVNMTCLCIPKL